MFSKSRSQRFAFGIMCFVFSVLLVIPSVAVQALSQDDANSIYNDTVWYQSGATSTSCTTTTLTGSGAAQQVWNYFIAKKLSPVATAALMGNFKDESGFDPTSTNPSSGAYGLVQWLGNRLTSLNTFAGQAGSPVSDLGVQLDFAWQELSGSYKSPVTDVINAPGESVQDATLTVYNYYEGLLNSGQGSISNRTSNAVGFLILYGSSAPTGPTASQPVSASSCSSGSSDVSGYQDPLRALEQNGSLTPERIDQGVDYSGSGPIYAIGNGKVLNVYNCGWGSCAGLGGAGAFIVYRLSDGPAAGKYVYVAENCPWKVQIGDSVTSNTVVCNLVNQFPNLETGWANGSALGAALASSVWPKSVDDTAHYTAYGLNFSQLLVKLGAPPGTIQPGAQQLGTLPGGWPTW